MDKEYLLSKVTSRKFLAAVVAGVIAVLADVGLIDPATSASIIAHVTPVVYIVMEGLLDLVKD